MGYEKWYNFYQMDGGWENGVEEHVQQNNFPQGDPEPIFLPLTQKCQKMHMMLVERKACFCVANAILSRLELAYN